MTTETSRYTTKAKLLHLVLAFAGIGAFASGEWAEHNDFAAGYQIHAWLGLAVAACLIIRLIFGLFFRSEHAFKSWAPFSLKQMRAARADVLMLCRLKFPEREPHGGLAGLVQACGLIVFGWMALTGTVIYFLGGNAMAESFEWLEELHEFGQSFIALYLLLHVGAVILHSICGQANWKNMFGSS